jgi:hypothetical protein
MLIEEILEGFVHAWGRKPGGRMVRRYRCTSGKKKGRVVASPSTCSTAVSPKKSYVLKRTKSMRGPAQAIRRKITMRRPTSHRVRSANRGRKRKIR